MKANLIGERKSKAEPSRFVPMKRFSALISEKPLAGWQERRFLDRKDEAVGLFIIYWQRGNAQIQPLPEQQSTSTLHHSI